MKNRLKIFAILAMIIPVSLVLFISIHGTQYGSPSRRIEYRYKDGLIYKKNSNDLFTGSIVDTSDVIITFEVVDGKKNGAFVTFYFNGNYEKYGLVKNNRNEGEWRYFYPSGQIESVGSFRTNRPSGKWTFYYPNGGVKADGMYIDGVKQGTWMYYDTNGRWTNIQFFSNGIAKDVLENA